MSRENEASAYRQAATTHSLETMTKVCEEAILEYIADHAGEDGAIYETCEIQIPITFEPIGYTTRDTFVRESKDRLIMSLESRNNRNWKCSIRGNLGIPASVLTIKPILHLNE